MAEPFVIVGQGGYRELQTDIERSCIAPPTKPFANGSDANNHLNLGYDEVSPVLRRPIQQGLKMMLDNAEVKLGRAGDGVHEVNADFLVPVPEGANGWVRAVSGLYTPERQMLQFQKVERRTFKPVGNTVEVIAEQMENSLDTPTVAVFDDATTDGGTTEAMCDYLEEEFGLDVLVAISIYYRGVLAELRSKYNRAFVVANHIPLTIDMDHHKKTGEIVEA